MFGLQKDKKPIENSHTTIGIRQSGVNTEKREKKNAGKKCVCEYSCAHFDTLQYLHITEVLLNENHYCNNNGRKLTFYSSEEDNMIYQT